MAEATTTKRKYNRRSPEQRIAELEAKIQEIKQRAAAKKKKQTDPVVKDIPRVQNRLRKFAQLAVDHDRMDLSNSTMAFVAQLERIRSDSLTAPVEVDAASDELEHDDGDET